MKNHTLSEFEFALLIKHTSKMPRAYCSCDEGESYVQFERYICCMPVYADDDDVGLQLAMASCKTCSMVTFLHLENLGLRYDMDKGLIERMIT